MNKYLCPHCGMEYEVTIPDEKPEPQVIGNQGFGKCPFCGGYLGWSCDFMRSEWTGEELSEEDDTLVQDCFCPNCGARITAFYPKEEQVDDYTKKLDEQNHQAFVFYTRQVVRYWLSYLSVFGTK